MHTVFANYKHGPLIPKMKKDNYYPRTIYSDGKYFKTKSGKAMLQTNDTTAVESLGDRREVVEIVHWTRVSRPGESGWHIINQYSTSAIQESCMGRPNSERELNLVDTGVDGSCAARRSNRKLQRASLQGKYNSVKIVISLNRVQWIVNTLTRNGIANILTHAALEGWATESLVQTALFEWGREVKKIWFLVITGNVPVFQAVA